MRSRAPASCGRRPGRWQWRRPAGPERQPPVWPLRGLLAADRSRLASRRATPAAGVSRFGTAGVGSRIETGRCPSPGGTAGGGSTARGRRAGARQAARPRPPSSGSSLWWSSHVWMRARLKRSRPRPPPTRVTGMRCSATSRRTWRSVMLRSWASSLRVSQVASGADGRCSWSIGVVTGPPVRWLADEYGYLEGLSGNDR